MTRKWLRFNRQLACPVCDHKDWCTYCPELNLACCMRVDSAKPCKNGGHFHPLNGEHTKKYQKPEPAPAPQIDAGALMNDFSRDTIPSALDCFAQSLGLSGDSLRAIGCQRAVRYGAWAFPMFGSNGQPCGIRLRRDDGSKFAVTGSKQGIFFPSRTPLKTAYIVEGASDLAALVEIGLWGLGRPSCCGCIIPITMTLSRHKINRAVIIADSDEPGLNGANALMKELEIPSLIFVPPAKDLRESVRLGLTVPLLESLIQSQTWHIPERKR